MELYSIEWEFEDCLPEVSDLDYDLMFHYSRIVNGVRMFPFITIYDHNGESKRIWLGA